MFGSKLQASVSVASGKNTGGHTGLSTELIRIYTKGSVWCTRQKRLKLSLGSRWGRWRPVGIDVWQGRKTSSGTLMKHLGRHQGSKAAEKLSNCQHCRKQEASPNQVPPPMIQALRYAPCYLALPPWLKMHPANKVPEKQTPSWQKSFWIMWWRLISEWHLRCDTGTQTGDLECHVKVIDGF